MALPQGPDGITNDWLSTALGRDVEAHDIEQIGIGVGLLGRLYRVTLGGGDTVIVKLPTLDEGARMNVVVPLRFYEKEVRFYNEAAPDTPIATPAVHLAEFEPESGDFALVLEDIGDRRMADQNVGCAIADAEIAVDALARLHAHYWRRDFMSMPWLPSYSDPPYPQVLAGMYKQSWPVAREIFGERLEPRYERFGERFAELIPWFLDEATVEPHSLVHGDFRLDNLFFAANDGDPSVTAVDWQICFRGRAGYDLAYFVSQSLATEDRRKAESGLIERYRAGLASRGVDYPAEEFDRDYRRTVAYCFIYPVVAGGQIDVTNERHRELLQSMLDRAVAAIEDADALGLLPA